MTADHLIEINGNEAHLNAQVIVFETRVTNNTTTIHPVESGYYDTHLKRINNTWKITKHNILLDHPLRPPTS